MNLEEAINEYIKKFGGFPYFLFMGASEETIIAVIEEALDSGVEIDTLDASIDYKGKIYTFLYNLV